MSRDVLTVGSTMRIPLLYRGEYFQWVERFMNYLEEQTDGEAMINSIKNGDQPLPRVTQVSIAITTSTEQPPLKDKYMCVAQGGETVEQHPTNFEETRALYESLYQNLAIEDEKVNSVNRKLKETNVNLTNNLLDKQILLEKRRKELNNIVLKTGQLIQTIHMLSPKPNSFYHTKQKMALGYQNPFYLKQAQKKQQSLYDGKVLLEKHDPLVVHDSEETLQLPQENRDKMKQMSKEIKPANYAKINHLSGVFVLQTALSRKELKFSNNSKLANVSKSFLIPNEDLSDDTTPSVARKFLN
nr:hypothetical protein [Tanacetum cinerariifolium]